MFTKKKFDVDSDFIIIAMVLFGLVTFGTICPYLAGAELIASNTVFSGILFILALASIIEGARMENEYSGDSGKLFAIFTTFMVTVVSFTITFPDESETLPETVSENYSIVEQTAQPEQLEQIISVYDADDNVVSQYIDNQVVTDNNSNTKYYIFGIFGIISLLILLFWWRQYKNQKNIEAKQTEAILNADIHTINKDLYLSEIERKYNRKE